MVPNNYVYHLFKIKVKSFPFVPMYSPFSRSLCLDAIVTPHANVMFLCYNTFQENKKKGSYFLLPAKFSYSSQVNLHYFHQLNFMFSFLCTHLIRTEPRGVDGAYEHGLSDFSW